MNKVIDLFQEKTITEALTQDCNCIECIKKQGIIEYLLEDRAAKEKRIEELIKNGPAAGECKVIAWHN